MNCITAFISVIAPWLQPPNMQIGIILNTLFIIPARYLSDRKMPDKAIDLVDEAASHLRLHQESKPVPIAQLEDKIASLKMEIEAVKKDDDNEKRMNQIQEELKHSEEQYQQLMKVCLLLFDRYRYRPGRTRNKPLTSSRNPMLNWNTNTES